MVNYYILELLKNLTEHQYNDFEDSSSSLDDLYALAEAEVDYTPQPQTHPLLFEKPDLAPFNPNVLNLGNSLFNNHTRDQLKSSNGDL